MKKGIFTAMVVLLCSAAVFAQQNFTVAAVTGYTMSAFEDQDDAAGTLPLGVQVGYKATPDLEVGAEINYALGGFGFEADYGSGKLTTTFNQTIFGVFGKYHFGKGTMKPYGKLGLGYYMGDADVEDKVGGDKQTDIDPAIGFNLGAGLLHSEKGFFAEFNYHIVSREAGGEKGGMNTWAVLVGYKFIR